MNLKGYVAMTGQPEAAAAIDLAENAGFVLPSFALTDRHAAAGNPAFVYYCDQVPVDQRAAAAGAGQGSGHDGRTAEVGGDATALTPVDATRR